MKTPESPKYDFEGSARKAFAFLSEHHFVEAESCPTLIRFRRGEIEVDVYHGRRSFEVGGGITAFGTRYSIPEIVRLSGPSLVKDFYYRVARNQHSIDASLEELSRLLNEYCLPALHGDTNFYTRLEAERKRGSKAYALEVLAGNVRPQAEEAFRRGDYALAVELYSQIRECLSPAELKKLSMAERRVKD